MKTIKIDEVVWDPSIYPRDKWSTSVVNEYVDVLKSGKQFKTPIVVEEGTNRLLDGKHRHLAYSKYQTEYDDASKSDKFDPNEWATPVDEIPVEYHKIPEGVPAYLYALSLSAKHGLRHTPTDKKTVARRVLQENPDFDVNRIAEYASVSWKTAKTYVEDLLARRKEEQKYIAYRTYLLGWTKEEVASGIGCPRKTVDDRYFSAKNGNPEKLQDFAKNSLPPDSEFGKLESSVKDLLNSGIPHLDVAERFNMPLILIHAIDLQGRTDEERMNRLNISIMPYDNWTFGKCNDLFGNDHPGRIPGQLVAHVLYFFTEQGDMVIDPMSGSGTTQDVCLAMGRKCYAYDIDTRHNRHDVIVHNIEKDGWHDRIKKADLIFWDPPYFSKMDKANIGENGYIEGSISQLQRDKYLEFFASRLADAKKMVKPGTKVAFLMSDWDDEKEEQEGIFIWDYANVMKEAGWKLKRQIQCPLSTQQVHPDIVNKFRKSKRLARLERYLIIGKAE